MDNTTLGTFLALLILVGIGWLVFRFLKACIRIVPLEKAAVVERKGEYKRTCTSKICFLIPFKEKIKGIEEGSFAELADDRNDSERKEEPSKPARKTKRKKKKTKRNDSLIDISYHTDKCYLRRLQSSDGADISVDFMVSWSVSDAGKLVSNCTNTAEALNALIRGNASQVFARHTAEELLKNPDKYIQELMLQLIKEGKSVGFAISRINLIRFSLPEEIIAILAEKKKAKLMGETRMIEADAYKNAMIMKAEGRAEAMRIETEAEDEAMKHKLANETKTIKAIKNAFSLNREEYMKYLLAMKYLDTIHTISQEGGKLDIALDDGIDKLLVKNEEKLISAETSAVE